jgi:hypothetical protein
MMGDKAQGDLYRITSQINPILLNGNFLCGRAHQKWVVIVKRKKIGGDVDPARVVHNADAGLLDRYVQSSKIIHAALLLLMLKAVPTDLVSPSA